MEEEWGSGVVRGWMGFVLKSKLKSLKASLKEWNRREYGNVETRLVKLKEDIDELDKRSERSLLSVEEVATRKHLFVEFWNLAKSKESLMAQRSRSKWLKEGDTNSKYFHRCVKTRTSRISMKALKVDGEWAQTPCDVRKVVVDYFKRHVEGCVGIRQPWRGFISNQLMMKLIVP